MALNKLKRGRRSENLPRLLDALSGSQSGLTKEELAVNLFGSADQSNLARVSNLISTGRRFLGNTGKTITAVPHDRPGMVPTYRYKVELSVDEAILGLRHRTARASGFANGYAKQAKALAQNFPELQGLILGRLVKVNEVLVEESREINARIGEVLRAGTIEELVAADPETKDLIIKEEVYYATVDSR